MLELPFGESATAQFPLPHLPTAHFSISLPKHSGLPARVIFWKILGKDLDLGHLGKGFESALGHSLSRSS